MKDKILFIADDESGVSSSIRALRKQYELVHTDSARDAFTLLCEKHSEFKLVLIDFYLPIQSNREFLKKKREIPAISHIPVVVISSNMSEGEQISGLSLGVTEYVDLHILPEILRLKVNSLIEQDKEIYRAISEVQDLKSKLEHDEMTGVLNKKNIEVAVNRYLKENSNELAAMLVIDIDHFKLVNDTLGHQAGDKVIQLIVNIITDLLRKTDLIGRVGGDEFCVLMKDIPSMDIVYSKARKLCQIMKYKPNLDIPEFVSVSVGISHNNRTETSFEEMFRQADAALYDAKKSGRARYCEYGFEPSSETEVLNDPIRLGSGKDCVLIVDDDSTSRKITRRILGSSYEILEAENGLEAIRLVGKNEHRIVAIVLDLIMPIMDGYQFMETLRRNIMSVPIPVIVVTSSTEQATDLRILSLGAEVILHKPMNAEMLLQYVSNQVETYKLSRKEVREYNAHKAMMVKGTDAFLCTYRFDTDSVEIGHEYQQYFNEDFPTFFENYPDGIKRFVLEIQQEQAIEFFDVINDSRTDEKIELRLKTSSSVYEWFEISKLYNYGDNGKPENIIFMFLKVERAVQAREKLLFMANNDMLTHIPNIRLFITNVEELLASHPNQNYVMISADIAQFRIINKVFGRKEGDSIIKFVANRIQEAVEGLDSGAYSRESADVFYFCVPENAQLFDFLDTVQTSVKNYPIDFHLQLYFGIYKMLDRNEPINVMMDHSSFARQKAKSTPSVTLQYYDGEMKKEETFENVAIAEMETAMKDQQFEVYYQPKCNIDTGEIVGAEALVRWIHPREGFLSPMYFIPVFESNGTCIDLDYYVYKHVCQALRKRLDAGEKIVPVSVNVSRWSLYNKMLIPNICELVDHYQIPHEYIEFEITESAFMLGSNLLTGFSTEMRAHGFKIDIDDFGSGYSSLNTLKEVPFDILKLDMKFLADIEQNKNAEIILASVVNMGRNLGLTILAEGVETQEELDILKKLGCQYVQGYYFYKPLPLAQFEQVLSKKEEQGAQ